LYDKAKRPELVALTYQQLGRDFANIPSAAAVLADSSLVRLPKSRLWPRIFAAWPSGEVEVKESDSAPLNQRNPFPVQTTHYYGAAPRGLKVIYDPGGNLSIRSDTGQITGAAPLGNSLRRTNTSFGPGPLLTAKLNGHLAVLNLGGDVVAIDGLRSDRERNRCSGDKIPATNRRAA